MTTDARLKLAVVLTALVAIFEGVGGFLAHSVTLLSDAAHVAMDVAALCIALAARLHARRPATPRRSYGFARIETVAALVNGALLFTVTTFLIVEALRRFHAPEPTDGGTMAFVALIGFICNCGVGALLLAGDVHAHAHGHAQEQSKSRHKHEAPEPHDHGAHGGGNVNLRAALLHVAGDALGSLAALIGGLCVARFGIAWIDPLLSLFVSGIIVVGIVRIAREAIDVLLQSVPSHADLDVVRARFLLVPGITAVHDLHIWSLSGTEHVLTAHVVLEDRRVSEAAALLRAIEEDLRDTHGITHVTIQFECAPCEELAHVICMRIPTTSREASGGV